jgi:hypothetical protein
MKATAIRCPACGTQKEIYLRARDSVIILNCPDCGALLLFHEGKAYHISKKGIRDAVRACGSRNIEGILELLKQQNKQAKGGKRFRSRPYRPGKRPERSDPINHEDIIDLVIDIHTTDSVNAFLEKLQ